MAGQPLHGRAQRQIVFPAKGLEHHLFKPGRRRDRQGRLHGLGRQLGLDRRLIAGLLVAGLGLRRGLVAGLRLDGLLLHGLRLDRRRLERHRRLGRQGLLVGQGRLIGLVGLIGPAGRLDRLLRGRLGRGRGNRLGLRLRSHGLGLGLGRSRRGGHLHLDRHGVLFRPQDLIDRNRQHVVDLGHLGQGPGRLGPHAGTSQASHDRLEIQGIFLADIRQLAPAQARRRVLGQPARRAPRGLHDHLEGLEHPTRGHAVLPGDLGQGQVGRFGLDVAHAQQGQGLVLLHAHAPGEVGQGGALGHGIGRLAVHFDGPVLDVVRQGHELLDRRQAGQGADKHEKTQDEPEKKRPGEHDHHAVGIAQVIEQAVPVEQQMGQARGAKKQSHAQMGAFPMGPGNAEERPVRPGGDPGRRHDVHDQRGQQHEEQGEKESQNYGLFEHRGAPEPARPAGRCRIARPLARLDLFAHPRGAGIRGRAG